MDPENPDVASDPSTDTQAEQTTDTATVKDAPPKDILERMDERMGEVAKDDTEDDTDPQATAKGKKADPKAKEEKAVDGKLQDIAGHAIARIPESDLEVVGVRIPRTTD